MVNDPALPVIAEPGPTSAPTRDYSQEIQAIIDDLDLPYAFKSGILPAIEQVQRKTAGKKIDPRVCCEFVIADAMRLIREARGELLRLRIAAKRGKVPQEQVLEFERAIPEEWFDIIVNRKPISKNAQAMKESEHVEKVIPKND